MSTDQKPKPCYRDRDNGVRFIKAEHAIDCTDTDCRGCKMCAEVGHCSARKNCTWHVAAGELTCGRCITGVRRDLRWIEALSSLMLTAAMGDGVNSEAANLAGPAADPRALSEWQVARKRYLRTWEALERITEEQHMHAIKAMDVDDEHHPYSVLTRWQMMLAEDYDAPMPARLTITGAAGYLERTLHRIAHDDGQDFPLLARELKKCRQHLESVLHNDTKPDKGAPCPTCREAGMVVRLNREYAHHCEADDCQKFHFTDDASDVWRCPKDAKHWWTQQGYADEVLDGRKSA